MLEQVRLEDIQAIAIGAGILGTSGGWQPLPRLTLYIKEPHHHE
jgi:DUF917 family protein